VRSIDGMMLTVDYLIAFVKNLSRYHTVHHKSHVKWPGMEPGYPRSEATD